MPATPAMPGQRLVVFSDDWGRHPSSCQHLIRELLPRYRVDWVNTIGTRRPRLNRADIQRGLGKLRAWLRPAVHEEAPGNAIDTGNLHVHSPVLWPGFKSGIERSLNRRLLLRSLRTVLEAEPRPVAVITTASIVADLARSTPEQRWIYYCVDDLSEWPGLDGDTLREMELELLPHMSEIVCVSEHLRRRMAELGRDTSMLTHGVDLAHWQSVEERRRAAGPRRGDRPVALYWGNVDRRLDTEICAALARDCELVLLGPRSELDPRLERLEGVRFVDAVPYAELPAQAANADVLVMPYADLPVTRAMQPLKLKEYLATGMPVVATPLEANLPWEAAMDLTWEPSRFGELVRERARKPLPAEQVNARRALVDEGWPAKALAFEATWSAT